MPFSQAHPIWGTSLPDGPFQQLSPWKAGEKVPKRSGRLESLGVLQLHHQSHFKLKSHFKAHAFNLLTGMCFNLGKLCTVSWWTELSAEFDHITDGLKWARMSAQWGQLSTSVYRFRKTFIFCRLRGSGPSAFTRVLNWGHLKLRHLSDYQMFVWPAFSPIGSMCFVCSGERHICFSALQASLMSLLAIP